MKENWAGEVFAPEPEGEGERKEGLKALPLRSGEQGQLDVDRRRSGGAQDDRGATFLRCDGTGDEETDLDEWVEVGGFVVGRTRTRELLSRNDLHKNGG